MKGKKTGGRQKGSINESTKQLKTVKEIVLSTWFFNTDNNCTTGWMKIGDLETGSLVTVNFKTMPYSANQFNYADPFLVYDLSVDINHKGKIETHQIIDPEEVLLTKKIFVPLF